MSQALFLLGLVPTAQGRLAERKALLYCLGTALRVPDRPPEKPLGEAVAPSDDPVLVEPPPDVAVVPGRPTGRWGSTVRGRTRV